jgi:predicted transporter
MGGKNTVMNVSILVFGLQIGMAVGFLMNLRQELRGYDKAFICEI